MEDGRTLNAEVGRVGRRLERQGVGDVAEEREGG